MANKIPAVLKPKNDQEASSVVPNFIDEVVEKKVEETSNTGENPKRKEISIDFTPQKVVSLDKEGYILTFDDTPDKFIDLSDNVVEKLSSFNRTSYLVSVGLHARRKREVEKPEEFATPGLTINPRLATATARLNVENMTPGMHPCWKRPDELRHAAYEGYTVARGEEIETFMGKEGDIHKVGAFGSDELILMEIPQELADQRMKDVVDKSIRRSEAVKSNAIEDLRQGGIPYDPPSGKGSDGKNWS